MTTAREDWLEARVVDFLARRDAGTSLSKELFLQEVAGTGATANALQLLSERLDSLSALEQDLGPQPPVVSVRIGQQIGQFRIEAELGHGGMGAVFRAFDSHLRRPVAIKAPLWTR